MTHKILYKIFFHYYIREPYLLTKFIIYDQPF